MQGLDEGVNLQVRYNAVDRGNNTSKKNPGFASTHLTQATDLLRDAVLR